MKRPLMDKISSVLGVSLFGSGVLIIGLPLLVILLIVLLILSSRFDSCREKRDAALYSVAYGQTAALDREWSGSEPRITVMERDDHGRVLFAASASSPYYDEKVTAYFICQFEDGSTGYCYPDICYLLSNEKLSKEDVTAFKERNDWNRELDREKCKAETAAPVYKTLKIDEIFFAYTGIEKSWTKNKCIDIDAEGKELFVLARYGRTDLGEREKLMYLIAVDAEGNVLALENVENKLDFSSYVQKIKTDIGWTEKYGLD